MRQIGVGTPGGAEALAVFRSRDPPHRVGEQAHSVDRLPES